MPVMFRIGRGYRGGRAGRSVGAQIHLVAAVLEIRDLVGAPRAAELKHVRSGTAEQGVRTGAAGQDVAALLTIKLVVARTARKGVVAEAAVEPVVARAAADLVLAAEPLEGIGPGGAFQDV